MQALPGIRILLRLNSTSWIGQETA
jgi:hypothetical protein